MNLVKRCHNLYTSCRSTHIVLDDLLQRRHHQNEHQRHQRREAAGRRDVRYLLQQRDHQKEAVRVAAELLEQEARQKAEHAVLGRRDVVVAVLGQLHLVDVDDALDQHLGVAAGRRLGGIVVVCVGGAAMKIWGGGGQRYST